MPEVPYVPADPPADPPMQNATSSGGETSLSPARSGNDSVSPLLTTRDATKQGMALQERKQQAQVAALGQEKEDSPVDDSGQQACLICLEDMPDVKPSISVCLHLGHVPCLQKWRTQKLREYHALKRKIQRSPNWVPSEGELQLKDIGDTGQFPCPVCWKGMTLPVPTPAVAIKGPSPWWKRWFSSGKK